MFKKLALGTFALALAVATVPMFAAFEAHVINVTATIENALSVEPQEIRFGTVFPQEQLDKQVTITTSGSFQAEENADDVEYMIRQKPKCALASPDGQTINFDNTTTGHVRIGDNLATPEVVETSWIDCGPKPVVDDAVNTVWGPLPSLCPYLSKHKVDRDTNQTEVEVDAFHTPYVIVQGDDPSTLNVVETSYIDWTEAHGRLAKSDQDILDTWNIDLKVPCFTGACAQDWATYVHGINPDADPNLFTQDPANEHKVFGCDLWIEVTGVSRFDEPTEPTTGHITVTKIVVNDNPEGGVGTAIVTDFTLKVGATTVTSGASTEFTAGNYAITEIGAQTANYTATFSGDCDSTGNIVLGVGQNLTCTITNNDNLVLQPAT